MNKEARCLRQYITRHVNHYSSPIHFGFVFGETTSSPVNVTWLSVLTDGYGTVINQLWKFTHASLWNSEKHSCH